MIDAIRAEAIRTLYAQMRNTTVAVGVILVFVIGTAWPFTPWPTILGWTLVIVLFQLAREALAHAFRGAQPEGEQLERWASAFILHQACAGAAWGSSMFLLADPAQPISVALTLCALFAVVAGAVPAQAYTPRSFYALALVLFAFVLARLLATGLFEYAMLGIASSLFGLAMAAYCRVQAGVVREGFRIRFENQQLLEQLERRTAEAEEARRSAERASLAKSQFLAAASHDLRQPLYALGLFSASLQELSLDAAAQDIVRRIQNSITAMEDLFESLLDLSKLEAGVVTPGPEPVAVHPLFDRIAQVFRPLALERGLELDLRCNGEWVSSDPMVLEQALANLVSNAVRYTERGRILIAVRRRGENLRFEVWDTGVGIAPDNLARIFDDYVQLGNPERDRRKGLGLGLSIARRSVELLGSSITVRSRPGRGSCFSFPQPLSPEPKRFPEQRLRRPGSLIQPIDRRSDLPVLVVEDDEEVRGALTELLVRWGVGVEAVATGSAALSLFENGGRFGLIVTDYRLAGDLSGLELVERLRTGYPEAPPAVIVTGDLDPQLTRDLARQRAPVLHKPVDPAQLRQLLGLTRPDFA